MSKKKQMLTDETEMERAGDEKPYPMHDDDEANLHTSDDIVVLFGVQRFRTDDGRRMFRPVSVMVDYRNDVVIDKRITRNTAQGVLYAMADAAMDLEDWAVHFSANRYAEIDW